MVSLVIEGNERTQCEALPEPSPPNFVRNFTLRRPALLRRGRAFGGGGLGRGGGGGSRSGGGGGDGGGVDHG
jgi:hypothetical protein